MKTAAVVGILLIVLGTVALAYQGISVTHRKQILKVGPLQATENKKEFVPLPPILGVIALVGGIGLVVVGSRNYG